MSALLTIKQGIQTEKTHELDPLQEYIVGRKEDCHIVLDSYPGISRQHFKIFHNGQAWIVEGLSGVKSLEYQGQSVARFEVQNGDFFNLPPYQFLWTQNRASTSPPSTNRAPGEQMEGSLDLPPQFPELTQHEQSNNTNGGLENLGDYTSSSQAQQPASASEALPSEPFNPMDHTHLQNSTNELGAFPHAGDTGSSFQDPGDQTEVQMVSSLPYIKIFEHAGKKAEYYRLNGHLWVAGSDEQAPIYLPTQQASSAHFEISRDKKKFSIIDLGTPIGTLLNGQRISTTQPTDLQSGDLINVGPLTLGFELRDQSFQEKISQIPLQMYKSPLVFFGEGAGQLDATPEELKQTPAVETKKPTVDNKTNLQKRLPLIALSLAIIGLVVFLDYNGKAQKKVAKTTVRKLTPFDKLSKGEKRIVKESYVIARRFYLNRKYDRAIRQYQKIHRVLASGYKSSLSDQADCENFIELKRQRLAIEREKRAQMALAKRVENNIRKCRRKFAKSTDLQSATLCLNVAQTSDPGNPGIEQLLSDIKARIEQQKAQQKRAREIAEQTRQGKNLFFKAQSLHQAELYLEAMDAFEAHIASGLPDPENYVFKSKRKLREIQTFIETQKSQLLVSARNIASTDLKEALIKARKAATVDPRDYEISLYVTKLEKDLNRVVRSLYMDSVLEERYGNLEASRLKWAEIIEKDVPDGDYYKKAARKLRQYGL